MSDAGKQLYNAVVLGIAIKKIMDQRGINPHQLVSQISYSIQAINNVLNGVNSPHSDTVRVAIINCLGFADYEQLLAGTQSILGNPELASAPIPPTPKLINLPEHTTQRKEFVERILQICSNAGYYRPSEIPGLQVNWDHVVAWSNGKEDYPTDKVKGIIEEVLTRLGTDIQGVLTDLEANAPSVPKPTIPKENPLLAAENRYYRAVGAAIAIVDSNLQQEKKIASIIPPLFFLQNCELYGADGKKNKATIRALAVKLFNPDDSRNRDIAIECGADNACLGVIRMAERFSKQTLWSEDIPEIYEVPAGGLTRNLQSARSQGSPITRP